MEKSLLSEEVVQHTLNDTRLGFAFAILASFVSLGMSTFQKFAGSGNMTPYTGNFIISCTGATTMAIILALRRTSIAMYFPNANVWLFSYGVALWFFMWGMVQSISLMDLATWTSTVECLNQVLVMLMANLALGESVGLFKILVLMRNFIVIALITKPPIIFGGHSAVSFAGLCFLLVQSTGAATGAMIQRRLCNQPTEVLIFWGFAWNVIYWLPPGVTPPDLRVPLLWPPSPEDNLRNINMQAMMFMTLSAMCNSLWYVFIGRGLQYVDVATLFFMYCPMSLGLNCLANLVVFNKSMDPLEMAGIVLIAIGFVVDRWYELRQERLNSPY